MDLTSIAKTLWRHKIVTLPIVVLIFIGAVYTVALKAPVYQANASYILINPPNPPTATQLAQDPSLGRLNSNNQLVGYGNLNIIVDLLAEDLNTGADRQMLVAKGANPLYTIAPNTTYLSAPILDIVGVGSTPAEATNTAKLVGNEMVNRLNEIQSQQGTSRKYFVTAEPLQIPTQAQAQLSSKLRSLIGILAAGAIILFVAVSTMNGIAERRRAAKGDGRVSDDEASASDWVADMNQIYNNHPQVYGFAPQAHGDPRQTYGHQPPPYGGHSQAYENPPLYDSEDSFDVPGDSLGSFGHDLGAKRRS
jgi:capsular polysaccharide biosynthesis protein